MKNFGNSLKRFIKNKNTITILGVLVIVGLLYFGYTYQINTQVKPVRVAVAATTIQPRTLIKDDMVTYIEVPQSAITSNVIRSSAAVVGHYSNYNTITQNSAGDITFECLEKKVKIFVSNPNYSVDFLTNEKSYNIGLGYYIGTLNL